MEIDAGKKAEKEDETDNVYLRIKLQSTNVLLLIM